MKLYSHRGNPWCRLYFHVSMTEGSSSPWEFSEMQIKAITSSKENIETSSLYLIIWVEVTSSLPSNNGESNDGSNHS